MIIELNTPFNALSKYNDGNRPRLQKTFLILLFSSIWYYDPIFVDIKALNLIQKNKTNNVCI